MEIYCKKFISFGNLLLKCIWKTYSNIPRQYNKYNKYKNVINKGLVYVKSCVESWRLPKKRQKSFSHEIFAVRKIYLISATGWANFTLKIFRKLPKFT